MPATGGRAYMLLLEDIRELAETEEYRNSPAVMLDELIGFHAQENMLNEMRIYMNAMRTDIPGRKHRGRPFASIENTTEIPVIEQPFDIKTEPFYQTLIPDLIPDFSTASPASSNSAVKRMDLEVQSSVPCLARQLTT